ncbi:hypothetical protein [Thiocapsa imhoffii]|uniref:hypothetical protein n=1 Tax=Thiocapsa imhoffii TaxID=382777 RepID=UPI0019057832|nr:hypothetical protein [Thiocapsa imhoffii]
MRVSTLVEGIKESVTGRLLAYIGPGKKGAEIRDQFDAPPYGWPRDAIEAQRSLLVEPDPVRPLLDKVVDLVRQALKAKLDAYRALFREQEDQLAEDADWNRLSETQRAELIEKHHLTPLADVPLGTPEQLQDALDDCDLDHWVSKTQALPNRFEAARHAAVQWLKTNVAHVSLPMRLLDSGDEAQASSPASRSSASRIGRPCQRLTKQSFIA